MSSVRILIADDHEVVRRGLKSVLETQPGWHVVGEASTGRAAVEEATRLKPDIAIIDITMPELNGLDTTRQLLKENADLQVLVLTMHESEELVREVFQAGGRGYLLKTDAGRELIAAVEAVLKGRPFISPGVSEIVLQGYLSATESQRDGGDPGTRLTAREREVVQLLAEGKSNLDIAQSLHISIKTVETHRANAMEKLGLHSLGELVRWALRNHLVGA